ncbi:MAG: hypothetical protein EBR20_06800, partial [Bacteroidetes bacterium]|nr:hypothetical protein [Bacteroidota bacterium]
MTYLKALFAGILLCTLHPASSSAQSLPDVTAELQPSSAIIVKGPVAASARSATSYRLEYLDGTDIPIAGVLPRRADEVLISPAHPLDTKRLYRLHIEGREDPVLVRRNDWFKSLYSDKALGAVVSDDDSKTTFRLFAPRADQVVLHLFLDRYQDLDTPSSSVLMTRDPDGVWEAEQAG